MFPWLKKLFKKSSGPDTCSAVTPEEDMQIAQAAMAEGDLKHSAFHVAAALITDPTRKEWLEFLNRLITIAPDPLVLAPMEEQNYAGTVAVRAYILAHLGRYNGPDGALSLIAQVARIKPDTPYLDWLVQWLEAPENVGKLDLQYLGGLIVRGEGSDADRQFAQLFHDPAAKPFVSRLPLVAKAAVKHQTDQNPISMLLVRILRMNGLVEEAVSVSEAVYAHAPGYYSAVSLATTYRESGNIERALELYEEAHRLDPSEAMVLLDLGDVNYQTGRLTEAERYYQMALEREPDHPWAVPSLLGLQVLQAAGEEEREARREELQQYVKVHEDNERALWILRSLYIPYFEAYLPEPGEAMINGFKGFLAQAETVDKGTNVRIGMSGLECPSAVQSIQAAMQARFGVGVEIEVAEIATPDPRKSTGDTAFVLWKYEGTDASPAVPVTHSSEVDAAIHAIAESPYIFTAWSGKAQEQAKDLDSSVVPALLWAMVSPPLQSESQMPTWTWMFRVQVAVALLLAFLEEGWQGTERRTNLLTLLHGPMDWSVSATIIALVAVAQAEDDASITSEIRREFQQLRRANPDQGYCCWLPVLLLGMMELPGTSPEEASILWNEYRALEG